MSDDGLAPSSDARLSRLEGSEMPADLPAIVGRNLRRLRIRRGHSLERLAKQSGVSRAMLGQIETGKSVPTIGLLWKVANALDVPFANLLQTDASRGAVVLRRSEAKLLTSSQGQFTSRALFPFGADNRDTEFYELRIAPLHREAAEPHESGTRENLVVVKGVVEIIAGSDKPLTGRVGCTAAAADAAAKFQPAGDFDFDASGPALLALHEQISALCVAVAGGRSRGRVFFARGISGANYSRMK